MNPAVSILRRRVLLGCSLLFALGSAPGPASAGGAKPAAGTDARAGAEGLWDQVDEKTGRVRAVTRVENQGGQLQAFLVKVYPRPGETLDASAICKPCVGEAAGKPVIGLRIVWGLTGTGTEWSGGHILDPENGKVYQAQASLEGNGERLRIRGFVGMPMFGRNVEWRRHDDAQGH